MSSTRPPSYDERFVVPVEASRRGAHRARVSPAFAFLPYVAVAAVLLGVGALAWTLVGSSLFGGTSTTGAQTGGGGATNSVTATGPTAAPSTPSATGTSTTAPPTTAPTTATSGVPAGLDPTTVITVYNGSNPAKPGLAARATAQLTSAGWVGAQVSKKSATSIGTTIVYYGKTELKSTALAVVKSLGVGKAKYSPARASKTMVVIMSNDYTG